MESNLSLSSSRVALRFLEKTVSINRSSFARTLDDPALEELEARLHQSREDLKVFSAQIASSPSHPEARSQFLKLDALERFCDQIAEASRSEGNWPLQNLELWQNELERALTAIREELERLGF